MRIQRAERKRHLMTKSLTVPERAAGKTPRFLIFPPLQRGGNCRTERADALWLVTPGPPPRPPLRKGGEKDRPRPASIRSRRSPPCTRRDQQSADLGFVPRRETKPLTETVPPQASTQTTPQPRLQSKATPRRHGSHDASTIFHATESFVLRIILSGRSHRNAYFSSISAYLIIIMITRSGPGLADIPITGARKSAQGTSHGSIAG
jgi:hypothetical protein